jgi:hypothetical protein
MAQRVLAPPSRTNSASVDVVKRQRRDEHEQHQVLKQQDAIDASDQREQGVVVHPDHADHEEADDIGGEARPALAELVRETAVAGGVDVQVEHEQRDRDRKDAVA